MASWEPGFSPVGTSVVANPGRVCSVSLQCVSWAFLTCPGQVWQCQQGPRDTGEMGAREDPKEGSGNEKSSLLLGYTTYYPARETSVCKER